jgi:hypothetical protein
MDKLSELEDRLERLESSSRNKDLVIIVLLFVAGFAIVATFFVPARSKQPEHSPQIAAETVIAEKLIVRSKESGPSIALRATDGECFVELLDLKQQPRVRLSLTPEPPKGQLRPSISLLHRDGNPTLQLNTDSLYCLPTVQILDQGHPRLMVGIDMMDRQPFFNVLDENGQTSGRYRLTPQGALKEEEGK